MEKRVNLFLNEIYEVTLSEFYTYIEKMGSNFENGLKSSWSYLDNKNTINATTYLLSNGFINIQCEFRYLIDNKLNSHVKFYDREELLSLILLYDRKNKLYKIKKILSGRKVFNSE